MLQLKCTIYDLKYQSAFHFLIQKLILHTEPPFQSFLEQIGKGANEIVETIMETVSEQDIQNILIYIAEKYNDKLKYSIEKAFLKKGLVITIDSISILLGDTKEYLIDMKFYIVSSSVKVLTPFVSDALVGSLLNIKFLREPLFSLIESVIPMQYNFIKIKDIQLAAK